MCGIAGTFNYRDLERPVDPNLLHAMTDSLAHRGPDGEGYWLAPGIGLGHRRLAILDLSDNAKQPMRDSAGEIVISYNGEIYNFRELRGVLEAKGHRFRSSGDTEVILAGYREWGRDVVSRISGIFAFAIYDARDRSLFLARDPLGVKPLFYSYDDECFRFASEIKAILFDPRVDREFDLQALDSFFTFSYTPAPATGFREIRQLLPGHALSVTTRGVTARRFWESPYREAPIDVDFTTAVPQFRERLIEVTRSQLVSDVPVGAFLSGGLDSAALVWAMKRADEGPVHPLCVGFDAPGFDERARARDTADSLQLDLAEISVSFEAVDLIPELSKHLEEPTADSSALPVYVLCKAAAERFKVAISGDGADELLAGYETYRATQLARRYRQIPRPLRQGLSHALTSLLPIRDVKYGLREKVSRFTYGAELGFGLDHCAWRVIFTDRTKQELYEPGFRSAVMNHRPLESYRQHMNGLPPSRSDLDALLKADLEFYLPNDMLVKVDRMSMAHGLEVRVPFLDESLVRYSVNLPPQFKLHRQRLRKHILRESLRDKLPTDVLHARKSGFNIPLGRWMRGALRDLLLDVVASSRDHLSEFLDLQQVAVLAEQHRRRRADHGYVLFTILMFALWLENIRHQWTFERRSRRPPPTAPAALAPTVRGPS